MSYLSIIRFNGSLFRFFWEPRFRDKIIIYQRITISRWEHYKKYLIRIWVFFCRNFVDGGSPISPLCQRSICFRKKSHFHLKKLWFAVTIHSMILMANRCQRSIHWPKGIGIKRKFSRKNRILAGSYGPVAIFDRNMSQLTMRTSL